MSSFSDAQRQQQAAIQQADQDQREASDPRASVFVSASAGSGKTKLLIDRLLRLMLPLETMAENGETIFLEGADPTRILCLTYTKAAAAEMANRLQSRLGRWVSLADDTLGAELKALDVPDNAQTRMYARGLFLKVLDMPGGLRVETIHAFCQSLLKRFPLEATLDPHFSLIEETDGLMALRQALERELVDHSDDTRELAGLVAFEHIVERVIGLNEKVSQLQSLMAMWKRHPERVVDAYRYLLKADQRTYDVLLEEARVLPAEETLRDGFALAWEKMTPSGRNIAQSFIDWLATSKEERSYDVLLSFFLTQDGSPRKMNRVVGKSARDVAPQLDEALAQEAERQAEFQELLRAQRLLIANQALLGLSIPVLWSFQKEKQRRGMVDYNDLISHTRELLRDPGVAWVMYKLDGGIDHLLLDEVQDTSALQWDIAGALTSDFFTGEGRHEDHPLRPRTVFAVGDFKQSIYSFQGAEPEQFYKWRREFSRRVQEAGLLWREPSLKVSFRSIEPVLQLVDAVFAHDGAARGLREGVDHALENHISARPGQGGRVELWPLVPARESVQDQGEEVSSPWRAPQRNTDQKSAPQRLAEALGDWISMKIGRAPQPGKAPLRAGDVLILVPKRSSFLRFLIRALKIRQVPVVSFIRSGLTEQIAVRDLMTLCAVLLLPQDDLSLASVLTSPFGGISDDSLMDLATAQRTKSVLGRGNISLWSVLRDRHVEREEWQHAWDHLFALYRRVDYETPYSILMQALGPQGGRARFLARLGPEAVESVDELLNAALMYEMEHSPSLQGFLHWLELSEASSRREGESDIDAVRVMTVHGSKGLQARLVVLPDTTSNAQQRSGVLWTRYHGVEIPLWIPHKSAMATRATMQIEQEAAEKACEERNRLLYVALTRASDMLVVCGWEPKKGLLDEQSWYQQCARGFADIKNVVSAPSSLEWGGECLYVEAPCIEEKREKSLQLASKPVVAHPEWMGEAPEWRVRPAPVEGGLMRPLTPSRPEGGEFGPTPVARSPLDIFKKRASKEDQLSDSSAHRQRAMQRGRLVHRLLQLLPDTPVEERAAKARHWLSRPAWKLEMQDVTRLCEQVMGVLEEPCLAPLFGSNSRAEQAVSGEVLGHTSENGQVVLGKVDRFCLTEDSVWLCDYKTGRYPPHDVMQTPSTYVRQMAAYRAVMAQVYPKREIRCFLVWTEGPHVSELPKRLLQNTPIIT